MGQANYSAAKAGDLGFTRLLRRKGAAKNITSTQFAPAYIATEMVLAVPEKVMNERILPQIPVGRLGEPKKLRAACCSWPPMRQASSQGRRLQPMAANISSDFGVSP